MNTVACKQDSMLRGAKKENRRVWPGWGACSLCFDAAYLPTCNYPVCQQHDNKVIRPVKLRCFLRLDGSTSITFARTWVFSVSIHRSLVNSQERQE